MTARQMTFELHQSHKPLDYFAFGFKGSPETVWALGIMDITDDQRHDLLQGCQKSAAQGHIENLQMFFAAYVAYRWQKNPGFDFYILDKHYRLFLTNPALEHICSGVTPETQTLSMIEAISPALQRRHTLYLLLEAAVETEKYFQVQGIIKAGADVNTCFSKLILMAFEAKDIRMLRLLHAGGANFDAAGKKLTDMDARKELELLHYKFQHDLDRAEIKRLKNAFDDVSTQLTSCENDKQVLLAKPPEKHADAPKLT